MLTSTERLGSLAASAGLQKFNATSSVVQNKPQKALRDYGKRRLRNKKASIREKRNKKKRPR